MPQCLAHVNRDISLPIAATAGQFIAWYAARDIVVLREMPGGWQVVRRLGYDAPDAMAVLLCAGALTIEHVVPDDATEPPATAPRLALVR